MSHFHNRVNRGMNNPEFVTGYIEADREVHLQALLARLQSPATREKVARRIAREDVYLDGETTMQWQERMTDAVIAVITKVLTEDSEQT